MKEIPFFNYPALFAEKEQKYNEIISKVLRSGFYIMGPELEQFELELAQYNGVKHAIGMADGTMAILCGLRASGIQPDDEVLVSAHTFVASAAAICHCGAKPVLVDVGTDHLISGEAVQKAITPRTKGIMPVQLNGRTANMDLIMGAVQENNLILVEDSCQALGSSFKGTNAGTFGSAGAFSFYPSKTLGCFGDGGALITNDDEVADRARTLRDHGRNLNGDIEVFGYNSRLDNLQAAVLLYKLRTYDEQIDYRRKLATIYDDRLSSSEFLRLPPAPEADDEHFDIYQNYEIEAENRDRLREFLAQKKVGTILQWGGKTLQQFPKLRLQGDVPNAEAITKKFLMLPMNTSLSDDDIHYICDIIEKFYKLHN